MPIRQRLSSTEDGRPVVIKQAGTAAEVERLRHEAAVLRAGTHPGVVEVLADRALPGGGHELMLLVAGTRTAADRRLPLTGVAGLVAALAATVADLHELGIVHGRIQGDHVVLDDRGRPVLCGFGDAARFEPGTTPTVARAADVAGLGALLRHLVTTADGGDHAWEPIPERRFRWAERWTVHARRALLNVADHATADDPATRPEARAFAAAVLAALPVARLPGAAGGADEAGAPLPSVPWPRRRFEVGRDALVRVLARAGELAERPRGRLVPIAAAVGLGLLVLGAGTLLRPGPTTAARGAIAASGAPVSAPPATAGAAGSTGPTTTSTVEPAACAAPEPSTAPTAVLVDHDGDGCRSAAVLGPGTVEVDGVRYLVGAPGDLLALGDWDCDGRATVGLVERPSGLVYLFDDWATAEGDATVEAIATVEQAATVRTGPGGGEGRACDALVVTDGAGRATAVAP